MREFDRAANRAFRLSAVDALGTGHGVGLEWDGLDSGSGCRAGMESNNYVMRLFLYVLRSVAGLRARVAILLARRRHSPLVLGFIGGNA